MRHQRHQARQPQRRVKRVFVEFETTPARRAGAPIRVRDQGAGFDPEEMANPLAPENLLKASGRGIFLIRNFMDDVQLRRAPQGGMEIRMIKRVSARRPPPPVRLSCASRPAPSRPPPSKRSFAPAT